MQQGVRGRRATKHLARGGDPAAARRANSVFEMLVALALFSVLVILIWMLMGNFLRREGKSSILTGTSRSLVLQQSRQAIRKLHYRLQGGTQILSPLPGITSRELVFRDSRNRQVRLRYVPAQKQLVAERSVEGEYASERRIGTTGEEHGFDVSFCENALFTVLSPRTVCVNFTTFDDRLKESYMIVITLANSRLAR